MIDWWLLYHSLLAGELRAWPPSVINSLTPTQLVALGHDKQPRPVIASVEEWHQLVAAKEAERTHWEQPIVQAGGTVR